VSAPSEVFGPYLVYEQLGIGGMASVHRAEVAGIEGFRKPIALKRMLPHVAANNDMVKSFVREAHLASYLRHSNVAQTYDLGKVGDIYFIAMELISGPNLRAILKHCASSIVGVMPVSVALNILNQMCDALDYAHNLCDESGKPLGIIHRDVSPSNIIVSEGGVVKLIDFGIAKVSGKGMQTMAGTIKGKFGYMAPEYIEGSIDARADLFALGVIAHELLTSRPLFTGPDDLETLQRVRKMEILPPSRINPEVSPEVDDIVMTALARDPEKRWQQATALRNAMTTVTKRLDLVISNAQVIEWVNWAFEQTNPRMRPAAKGSIPVADEPSIEVHQGTEGSTKVLPTSKHLADRIAMRGAGGGWPERPHDTPVGTPQKITAQTEPAYERHDALVPTQSRLSDDVVPTIVRPSAPRIEPSLPRTFTPSSPSTPRTFTPQRSERSSGSNISMTLAGVSPARRAHTTQDPPNRPSSPSNPPPNVPAAKGSGLGTEAPVAAAAKRGKSGALVTVILVLFAAALAATLVYFVLPLLT
jgi:serine/threonine protein kinase